MITRFDPVSVCSEADMREHANGDYVSYEDHAAALAAKDAEIERLREALEPFADVAQYILAEAPAEATMWQAYASCDGSVAQISLEYLRRARAALNPESAK